MANVLAQVTLPAKSAIPRDNVVNTFAFLTPLAEAADIDYLGIAGAIELFYNTAPSGHNSIAGFINESIARTADSVVIKFYDLAGHLDGSPHGSPRSIQTFTLAAMVPGAEALPREIAACLTFQCAYGSDAEFAGHTRPRARDRGRIYIGPLTSSTGQTDATTGRRRFTTSFQETLTLAAAALVAFPGSAWAVWSRKAGLLNPVVGGWCDDAYDVQRRRGERPVARTLFA
jgi:hypothetical protein